MQDAIITVASSHMMQMNARKYRPKSIVSGLATPTGKEASFKQS